MNSNLLAPKMHFLATHANSKLPTKNHKDDAGWDLYAVENTIIPKRGRVVVPVGLTLAHLEPGYWMRVSPRSGLSFKHGITVHPGVIDTGYRGDLGVLMYNHSDTEYEVKEGDRIAQIILHFNIDIEAGWGEIQDTDRGEKGFGSSGK